MPSEVRKLGEYYVQRSQHIDAHNFSYTVWEPVKTDAGYEFPRHSTLTKLDGQDFWVGKLGSRPLPAEIAALTVASDERCKACDRFYRAQARLAYRIIGKAFPHVLGLIARNCGRTESTGTISTTEVGA